MVVENIACSIAATVIYEGLKGIGSYLKKEYQYGNKQSGERAIINNIVKGKYNREFDELVESSLFNKFMSSPQVFDLLRDYIQYTATNRTKGYLKLAKNKIKQTNEIKESDIVEYLVEQYSKMAEVEDKSIDKIKFKRYLEYIFICLEDLMYEKLNPNDKYMLYNVNKQLRVQTSKLSALGHTINSLDERIKRILKVNVVLIEDNYEQIRNRYTQIMNSYYKQGFIYLLGEYTFNEFYVVPELSKYRVVLEYK